MMIDKSIIFLLIRKNFRMKKLFLLLVMAFPFFGISQLHKKFQGNYVSKTDAIVLYQLSTNINSTEDYVQIEASKWCLNLSSATFKMKINAESFSGKLEVIRTSKKEIQVELTNPILGKLELALYPKNKMYTMKHKGLSSPLIFEKMAKNENCSN